VKRAIGLTLATIACIVAFLSVRGTLPFMPIYGSSMSPTLKSGSLMMIQSIDPKNVKVGDIIVYSVPSAVRSYYNYPSLVSHRVISINTIPALTFRTKGDNTGEDPFTVRAQDIRGTVGKQIPFLGLPLLFFQSKQGMIFAIIALALMGLFMYGGEISRGGSWLHHGIFSPVINEEKKTNRMLTRKIESTEKKMDSTEQALEKFTAAVAEYAKHLASHTSAIQGLSEASHELKKGAAEQNRVLAAMLDSLPRNGAAKENIIVAKEAVGKKAAAVKEEITEPVKKTTTSSRKRYVVVPKPEAKPEASEKPDYHKALKKGVTPVYAHKRAATAEDKPAKRAR
jgi:signal peptidase I